MKTIQKVELAELSAVSGGAELVRKAGGDSLLILLVALLLKYLHGVVSLPKRTDGF